ncbi:tetratricopeptide repeat protein [Changchengzhania lutea]|uniref:tetratricopeptide repeat protein n=1 Tax=Changchengzhania lutea TaxID=2049305 RepID=UPI00115E5ADA|nr:tetratricopeptide repeat protein [Changchengzhania lutea]
MKRITIILFIIMPLLGIAQAGKLYRQALKTADLSERISLLDQVIEQEPDKLDAYFYRGLAKNDLGDYSGAIVDYSKIILTKPDPDTYFNRGNSRYSLLNYEGAKEDYKSAIELDPYFIDAIYSLGCSKYDLGHYDDAISDFNTVISIEPYSSEAYKMRAFTHWALKKYKLALADYTMVILIDPTDDAYYNRGVFFMDIKYYKKAKSDFTKSLRINKNNGFAYFYRGASHLLLGKFNDAISDFNTALKFDSKDFDALLGLAMTFQKVNDLEKAKLNFEKAQSIILTNAITKDGIAPYSNTYWYKNEFYVFNESFKVLSKL